MPQHFHNYRSIWAIVPIILLILLIIKNTQKIQAQIFLVGFFSIWLLIFEYFNIYETKFKKRHGYILQDTQNNFKLFVKKQLKTGIPAVIIIDPNKAPNLGWKFFSGFLSIFFPKETFIVKSANNKKTFFITNGIYYIKSTEGWRDHFLYKSEVSLPDKYMTVDIKPEYLKIFNKHHFPKSKELLNLNKALQSDIQGKLR